MTFPTLGNPNCAESPGCCGFRGLVAACVNDNDGVNANMIEWVNQYDLSQVPWGYLRGVTFSTPAVTAPDNLGSNGQPVDELNAGCLGVSQCFLIDNTGAPFVNANIIRCQVWWPGESLFGVIVVDCWNPYQTLYLTCCGQTAACSNIYELPVPAGLPGGVPSNRVRYVANLGLTASTIQQYYITGLAFGVAANYGSGQTPTPSSPVNFNQVCQAQGDDPFTGEADP